jgi:hypothetical protein
MSGAEESSHEHQVGITNAQETNPDLTIADLTSEMNARFAAGDYLEAARIAFSITALGREDLRQTFKRHGVRVLHLDHEAFGIYEVIEPSYDLRVDGATRDVLAAGTEFGKRHAQEAVLIARRLEEGETDSAECLGLIIVLQQNIKIETAVEIVDVVRDCGFKGATFAPKRNGEVSIYHTDDLRMTTDQFRKAAILLVARLRTLYLQAQYTVDPYLVLMPKL